MGEAILVLGGARSGKSRLAQSLAAEHEPVTYLATATVDPSDSEMAARVSRHQADRPAHWTTHEEPRNLAEALVKLTALDGSVLVDCVTLWLTNLMLGLGGGQPLADDAILHEVNRAGAMARAGRARVVWVSNEVGSGGVPENAMARRFNDLQGFANQQLALACDAVHFCIAGLSLRLK
jgi:adenosylcobinamide kinase/adenosylcobinamide-phosphate guanylyltransferase